MRRTLADEARHGLTWIDVVDPTADELAAIAREYGLHRTSVQDCLEPGHLPKYEKFPGSSFMIVRAYDEQSTATCATIQEFTRKVAIFAGPKFLITIHRTDQAYYQTAVAAILADLPSPANGDVPESPVPQVVLSIVNVAVDSFTKPMETIEAGIEQFEAKVFGDHDVTVTMKQVYVLKRRTMLLKRLFWHTLSVVQKMTPASDRTAPLYQDLRENVESNYVWADELLEEVNNLLSIQLAMASHRTNEVVRVLTVFSVFFLPLTFIVGIYGMNFQFMPELRSPYGYPGVMALMAVVTLLIFAWFRRRGWLRR